MVNLMNRVMMGLVLAGVWCAWMILKPFHRLPETETREEKVEV